jgi:hypothetical protein
VLRSDDNLDLVQEVKDRQRLLALLRARRREDRSKRSRPSAID